MRGALHIAIPVILLVTLGAALVGLLTCSLPGNYVQMDVPRCSSLSGCMKIAQFDNRASAYAWQVGRAWYFVNQFRNDLALISKSCGRSNETNDFAFIVLNGKYVLDSAQHLKSAMLAADASVTYVQNSLRGVSDTLHRGGIQYVSGTPYDAVASQISLVLYDLDHNRSNRALSSAILSYRAAKSEFTHKISEYLPNASQFLLSTVKSPFHELVYVGASVTSYFLSTRSSDVRLLQSAVGIHDSVFSAYRSLMESYYSAEDDADRRASEFLSDAADLRDRIYKISGELDRSAYTVLGERYVSIIAPNTIKYRSIVVNTSDSASVRAKADALYWDTYQSISRYRSRDSNFLVWWVRARGDVRKLSDLHAGLSDDLAALDSLADSCQKFLSKYRPRSSYARIRIPAIAAAMKQDQNIALRLLYCKDGLDVYFLDRNYASDEAMLAACERSISCWTDYPCHQDDASRRLDCCLAFRQRKVAELRSSPLYTSYLQLRRELAKTAAFCGLSDLDAKLAALPVQFTCRDKLRDAVTDLLALRSKYASVAADCAPLNVSYVGYFDAKEVSSLKLRVVYGIHGLSARRVVSVPFRVASYRTLESNGLSVSFDGNRMLLSGGGSALLEITAYPVPLSVEHLGDSMGHSRLKLINNSDLPVKYALDGVLLGSDGLVYRAGRYLFFPPHSYAVVEIPTLRVDYSDSNGFVTIHNDSAVRYHGTVVLPFFTEHPPSYCASDGNVTICNVSLDPYSSRVIRIGSHGPIITTSLPDGAQEQDVQISPAVHSASVTSFDAPSPSSQPVVSESNVLRERIRSLIAELNSYYRRAEELNVTYLLPFSPETLHSAEALLSSADRPSLSVLYNVLRDERDGLRAKAGYSVAALSRMPGHERDYAVAKSAYDRGDYVLALAVAEPLMHGYGSNSDSWLPGVLGLLSFLALITYVFRTYRPKKKRRIPKI
ncbi:MAG: hypothetical protein GXN93_00855 [Candidatus Diapherotrites archaeon]|nr:hypothetical protein [Candidatus Diapherotrites archaeon]